MANADHQEGLADMKCQYGICQKEAKRILTAPPLRDRMLCTDHVWSVEAALAGICVETEVRAIEEKEKVDGQ